MARRSAPTDLHKRQLIQRVARASGISEAKVADVMAAIVDEIAAAMLRNDAVVWTGLGRFEMRRRNSHGGYNPKTQERITIPAHDSPYCTIGATFKGRVAGLATFPEDIAAD